MQPSTKILLRENLHDSLLDKSRQRFHPLGHSPLAGRKAVRWFMIGHIGVIALVVHTPVLPVAVPHSRELSMVLTLRDRTIAPFTAVLLASFRMFCVAEIAHFFHLLTK